LVRLLEQTRQCGGAAMDHLARAEDLRRRAAMCITSAKETTSHAFKDCFKLLAINYLIQAKLEEDFVAANEKICGK
jgi:hypothetical protein